MVNTWGIPTNIRLQPSPLVFNIGPKISEQQEKEVTEEY